MLCFDTSLLLLQEKIFKLQSENSKFEAGAENRSGKFVEVVNLVICKGACKGAGDTGAARAATFVALMVRGAAWGQHGGRK